MIEKIAGKQRGHGLAFDRAIHDAILEHSRATYPLEACGLLAGQNGRVQRCYPIDNIRHSAFMFQMDPRQQVQAMLDINAQGLELTAIYHSHPEGPAWPSASDVAQAYYPEAIQLIIARPVMATPEIHAFTIVDGVVQEVPWRIE